jgi:hypothetical protein
MRQGRVLHIENDRFRYHASGSYADVFVSEDRSRCWKVFRLQSASMRSSEVFDSEVKAYSLLSQYPALARHAPTFFGTINCEARVTDDNIMDVSHEYFSNLMYQMEFCDLYFRKLGSFPFEKTASLRKQLSAIGIHHLSDASIGFKNESGECKLIDFAIHEIELWH